MNSAVAESPPPVAPGRSLSAAAILLFATLGLLWFILCRDLSLEWSSNEQYSYGWFVPFFAAFLFWLRFEEAAHLRSGYRLSVNGSLDSARTAPAITNNQQLITIGAIIGLAMIAPIRLFEYANPDWRPLSWVHALTVVGLTLLVVGYRGGKAAVRHFAFPVCFILVAVPWLTPIEAPLVQWLMRLVAAVATETLTLFGIPAQLEGNLIRVNNGVVGVSEACSGVRSLQTSLMIGLLFGELKRLTIWRRVALVAAALGIALFANFGRALFLVWIAAVQNLAAVERWHDIAGYAIVGAVFLGTIAIASALARTPGSARASRALAGAPPDSSPEREVRSQKEEGRNAGASLSAHDLRSQTPDFTTSGRHARLYIFPPSSFLLLTLSWLLLTEASVTSWYRWHESKLVPGRAWTVEWPVNAPGFKEVPIDEHTREMLRFDAGRQATWLLSPAVRPGTPDDVPALDCAGQAYLFFFRWEPGTATVLRARAHRPDICLPAVGWTPASQPDVRSYPVGGDLALPFQHFSFRHDEPGGRPVYAETFFCLREDRVRAGSGGNSETLPFSNWSIRERWEVVRKGLRNPGQQVMEFVLLSRRSLSATEAEAEFASLVPGLVREEK